MRDHRRCRKHISSHDCHIEGLETIQFRHIIDTITIQPSLIMEKSVAQQQALSPKISEDGTAYEPTHADSRRVSYYNIHVSDGVDGAVMDEAHVSGKAMNFFQMYSIIVIGASAFLYGYDNAIVSPVAALHPFIEHYQGINPNTGTYVFTANNQSLIFSVPIVGSVIGALTAPIFQKYFGRKTILLGSYSTLR